MTGSQNILGPPDGSRSKLHFRRNVRISREKMLRRAQHEGKNSERDGRNVQVRASGDEIQ